VVTAMADPRRLPLTAPTDDAIVIELPPLPAIVRGRVHHRRHHPIVHDVDARTSPWLVDVNDLPQHWPLATFRTDDHLSGQGVSLRAEVVAAAAEHGAATAPADRIVMLACPRSFGHTFNPLSVFWCVATDGHLRWALLEVHNTFGGRHHQLVHPDADGRAELPKEFYVSPFLTVDGTYHVRLRLDRRRVAVDVNLHQDGQPMLSARVYGPLGPAGRRARWWAALRTPLAMHQTTARIHLHGVWLWARRIPVVPRTVVS